MKYFLRQLSSPYPRFLQHNALMREGAASRWWNYISDIVTAWPALLTEQLVWRGKFEWFITRWESLKQDRWTQLSELDLQVDGHSALNSTLQCRGALPSKFVEMRLVDRAGRRVTCNNVWPELDCFSNTIISCWHDPTFHPVLTLITQRSQPILDQFKTVAININTEKLFPPLDHSLSDQFNGFIV